ncbi:glycerol-3-phosphate dehydrogenase/oxidase [soil metagenome]
MPTRAPALAEAARRTFDILVIGGGATGLGTALDAAARGHRTVLLESNDFASATSSRSTKLIHGGVRYLRQGNLSLVLGALRERGRLLRNAPHLAHEREFVIPAYRWWEKPYYLTGLKLYDALARDLGLARSRLLERAEKLIRLPNDKPQRLRGGVAYSDGQFDDARLAVDLALAAIARGATVLNHVRVTGILRSPDGRATGVTAQDAETGDSLDCRAKVVINATGIFADRLRRLDDPDAEPMLSFSRGAHLVLPARFLGGESALMVPSTPDGRILFGVPWHGRVLLGTTDVPAPDPVPDPRPTPDEIAYLLETAAPYLADAPTPDDILTVFAGLRALVSPPGGTRKTSAISRDHTMVTARSGLVTIAGGKWTTYRQMAEDVVSHAERIGGLPHRPCPTADLQIPGPAPSAGPPTDAQVIHATRHELARTVDDILARRSRALILDARASMAAAPRVAALMAAELDRSQSWQAAQVESYQALAHRYLPQE